jgi:hypothetical protein
MLKIILTTLVIVVGLVAIAAWRPEWLRRAVEALVVAGAAVAAWEWDKLLSAVTGLF